MKLIDLPPAWAPPREHPNFKLTHEFRYALGLVCEACVDPYDPILIRLAVLDVETVPGALNPFGKLRRLVTEMKDRSRGQPSITIARVGWLSRMMQHIAATEDDDLDIAESAFRGIVVSMGEIPIEFQGDGAEILRTYREQGFAAAWTKAETVGEVIALRRIVRYQRHSVHTKLAILVDWTDAHNAALDRQLLVLGQEVSP